MTTIRDIAKITGYSVSMVSRVINQHPYVDEAKRQEILAVMDELQYVPNRIAQNLSHGKSQTIGIILPFTNHPYYDQLLSGMMDAAFAKSYQVTLLPTNYEPELERRYLEQFSTRTFDGLIVATRTNSIDVFAPYLKYGPIIFCEATPEIDAACVYIDLETSLTKALYHLKAAGVKNLGITLGRKKTLSYNSKLTLTLCEAIMPDFNSDNIFWDTCSAASGLAASRFFQAQGVDGILTNGDEIAATILRQYPVDEAPMVVGWENLLLSEVMGFSTIDHHLATCGATAFRLFEEDSRDKIVIPGEFIPR